MLTALVKQISFRAEILHCLQFEKMSVYFNLDIKAFENGNIWKWWLNCGKYPTMKKKQI